jgi:hypothetical protein
MDPFASVFGKPLSIRSGGQTGVDRAALDVAIAKNIPYLGWCPRGGWAEDFHTPPGLLTKYDKLRETPSAAPEQRTAWNVRDSDATLFILNRAGAESKGTSFARVCAELVFVRPYHVVEIESIEASGLHTWLRSVTKATERDVFELNIAGPRESEAIGIYAAAFDFLGDLVSKGWRDR